MGWPRLTRRLGDLWRQAATRLAEGIGAICDEVAHVYRGLDGIVDAFAGPSRRKLHAQNATDPGQDH